MLIGVPREIASGERRVALVPEAVPQLTRAGHRVLIEHDAGLRAGFTDQSYRDAGAEIVESAGEVYAGAQMVLKVQRPGREVASGEAELDMLRGGTVLIGLLQPAGDPALFNSLLSETSPRSAWSSFRARLAPK